MTIGSLASLSFAGRVWNDKKLLQEQGTAVYKGLGKSWHDTSGMSSAVVKF